MAYKGHEKLWAADSLSWLIIPQFLGDLASVFPPTPAGSCWYFIQAKHGLRATAATFL